MMELVISTLYSSIAAMFFEYFLNMGGLCSCQYNICESQTSGVLL